MPVIEVFADVCCPFAHLGLRRLLGRREQRGADDVAVRARAWPLELVNGRPLDPAVVAEEVEALRAQVAPDLFAGFDRHRFPTTSLPALALAEVAFRDGTARGERVSLALRHALFEEGRDVSDAAVLDAIATAHDLPAPDAAAHRAVRDDLVAGRARGVTGSPHFFVPGRDSFCPSLEITRDGGRLRIVGDPAAFDAFLDDCLGG